MSTGHLNVPAAEFKAKCLSLLDQVHASGERITITKRGKVVAQLVPAGAADTRPWERLDGKARWAGDPISPVVVRIEGDAG